MKSFNFFKIVKNKNIATLYLNRPDKMNAMNWAFWDELPKAIAEIESDKEIHAVIITGKGKVFSIGLDVFDFVERFGMALMGDSKDSREQLMNLILTMQKGMNAIANGKKIYIAAVNSHCIGGALDLIAACDIRIGSKDSIYSLRETKLGIVADMGSLQRLPYIIGQSNTRLMAFTGRDIDAATALGMGLISQICDGTKELESEAKLLATEIANNPFSAVYGSKVMLNRMTEKTINDGLRDIAGWNSSFIDIQEIQKELMKHLNNK